MLSEMKIYFLICLVSSCFEALTILQIGPVMEKLLDPNNNSKVFIGADLNINSYYLFFLLALIVTCARIYILYKQTDLAFRVGVFAQNSLVLKTLNNPWALERLSSSDFISLSAVKTERLIRETCLQFLMIINSFFIITAIIFSLFFKNPLVTLAAVFSISFIYIGIVRLFRKWRSRASNNISKLQDENIAALEDIYNARLEIGLYKRIFIFLPM